MKFKEIKDQFFDYFLHGIDKNDIIAIKTAFNDHTDFLCKDGIITESQYNRICLKEKEIKRYIKKILLNKEL